MSSSGPVITLTQIVPAITATLATTTSVTVSGSTGLQVHVDNNGVPVVQLGTVGVSGTVTVANFPGSINVYTSGPQAVSGNVSLVNWPATFGVSASVPLIINAPQPVGISGSVALTNWPAVIGVSSSAPLTVFNPQTVGVSGSVSVTNFPNNQQVFIGGTQVVSGAVAVTNWPATIGVSASAPFTVFQPQPVGITGSVGVYTSGPQAVSGAVSVANWPAVHGVTGSVNVYTSGPQSVSGSVALTNWPAVVGVSSSSPFTVYNPATVGVSGTVTANVTVTGSTGLATVVQNLPMITSSAGKTGVVVHTNFTDGPNLDAFHRLRVSNPLGLFASKFLYDSQPLFWDDEQVSGGGTSSQFLPNAAQVAMTVAGATAGKRVRQTFKRFIYQPGKSQFTEATLVPWANGGIPLPNVNRAWGLFDDNNGYFFFMSGSNTYAAVRSSTSGVPITTLITQSLWNVDTLDGSGSPANPSGKKLFFDNDTFSCIDFQWLGAGRIRYGFDFNDGNIVYCHQLKVANNSLSASISNPNLPLRMEIESLGGGSGVDSIKQQCEVVISEGGQEDIGDFIAVDTGPSSSLTTLNNTNWYVLLAVQLQSNRLFTQVEPTFFTVGTNLGGAGAMIFARLLINPIIAGSLSYLPVVSSSLQYAVGAQANTITQGSGYPIFSGYFPVGTGNANATVSAIPVGDVALGSNIAGTSDTLVLAIQTVPSTAASFFGSLIVKELT